MLIQVDDVANYFYFYLKPFDTSDFSIHQITAWTKLARHRKVRDQLDTIEKLETKLKSSLKDWN